MLTFLVLCLVGLVLLAVGWPVAIAVLVLLPILCVIAIPLLLLALLAIPLLLIVLVLGVVLAIVKAVLWLPLRLVGLA